MKIGYARVSTLDQNLALQDDALKAAGCEKIFTDKVSSAKSERPNFEKMLEQLRKGDVVVVWRFDRLARSVKELIKFIELFREKGVAFESLTEKIDTSSPSGKLTFHLFASIAEFERDLIVERTQAGLQAARKRGLKGGRPAISSEKCDIVRLLYKSGKNVKDISKQLKIGYSTVYKILKDAEQ